MKKFTHAWIAFKAIERLQKAEVPASLRPEADFLVDWFSDHKDGVIRGSWYPDEVIVDNGTSHIMKYRCESASPPLEYTNLPGTSLLFRAGQNSPLKSAGVTIDAKNDLPQRCNSLYHSVIDNFKIQQNEEKGSSLSPNDNHIALLLFMLSHYIADAHMPLHCDGRSAMYGSFDLHDAIETRWEREVVARYEIDRPNQRFFYDPQGYPLVRAGYTETNCLLSQVEEELNHRRFVSGYGACGNLESYMLNVCRYSFLLSHAYLPEGTKTTEWDKTELQLKSNPSITFTNMSLASLADAVEAIARVWLQATSDFIKWKDVIAQK